MNGKSDHVFELWKHVKASGIRQSKTQPRPAKPREVQQGPVKPSKAQEKQRPKKRVMTRPRKHSWWHVPENIRDDTSQQNPA